MSILWIMPNWAAPSELWMQRMLEAVSDHLGAVASYKPTESRWHGRIPAIDLIDADHAADVLRQALAQHDFTHVVVHYLAFATRLEPVWRATDLPLFIHAHGFDVTWDLIRDGRRAFTDDYPDRVLQLSRRATIIANSRTTQRRLLDIGIPSDRIVVKYLGVPVPSSPPQHPHSPDQPLELLYLGRLVDFKGPDLTILAFERACKQGLNARLALAGDGPLHQSCTHLRDQSPLRDWITLPGAVDAATGENLRRRAHLFTAHSCVGPQTRQAEAFGVSFVEAMAAALPIVTGRAGSLPEIIQHDREGLLFEPGDIDAHAAALLRLGNDHILRDTMARAAWQRAGDQFSDAREKHAWLNLLKSDQARC